MSTPTRTFGGLPRPVWVLLALTLVTVVADFMVVPYFAVYFSRVLDLGVAFAAAALTAFTLLSKTAQVVGGWLIDRLAPERLLAVGFAIMILAYLVLAIARSAPAAAIGMLLLGLGDGCLVIAMRYKLVSGCDAELRPRVFSLTSICFNLGAMVGPLVGVLLFTFSPSWTFGCAAVVYAGSYAALRLFTESRPASRASAVPARDTRAGLHEMFTDRRLLPVVLLITGFWVIFSQFQFSLPVVVTALDPAHGTTTIAAMFAVNGALIVVFSLPLTRALEARPARTVMQAGFLLTLLGYLLLAAVQQLRLPQPWVFLPIVVLTVGEILFNTFANTHIAAIAPPHRLATYLGLLGLLTGLGTALGNTLSGALVPPLLSAGQPWLVWTTFAAVAGLPLVLTLGLRRRVISHPRTTAISAAHDVVAEHPSGSR
jgi:DHA1 family multidrug resistance protein-like MFS transporter